MILEFALVTVRVEFQAAVDENEEDAAEAQLCLGGLEQDRIDQVEPNLEPHPESGAGVELAGVELARQQL